MPDLRFIDTPKAKLKLPPRRCVGLRITHYTPPEVPSRNRRTSTEIPGKGEVTNMRAKKKKTNKKIKVQDLVPRKDPKGRMSQSPPKDAKWILRHLQLGQSTPER